MKKITIALLAMMMLVVFVGCGSDKNEVADNSKTAEQTEQSSTSTDESKSNESEAPEESSQEASETADTGVKKTKNQMLTPDGAQILTDDETVLMIFSDMAKDDLIEFYVNRIAEMGAIDGSEIKTSADDAWLYHATLNGEGVDVAIMFKEGQPAAITVEYGF